MIPSTALPVLMLQVQAHTDSAKGMRFLLVAGAPIGEPIVQHGPFVMNTKACRCSDAQ